MAGIDGPAARFSIDSGDVPPEVFGLTAYADPVAAAPRVDRRSAIQVPAVKRARDLVPGTLGGLPFNLIDRETRERVPSPLLEQPEADVPRSVTMAKTFDDLFFEGVAWWRVVETDTGTLEGWPTKVRRLEPRTVDVTKEGKVYITPSGHSGQAVEWPDDAELIRFDSPNDPLLVAAARAIRTILNLDAAAANGAAGVPPVDYFIPAGDFDPFDPDDAEDTPQTMLAAWEAARRLGRTAYVPAALKYMTAGWSPEQLQLVETRQHAVLEIARSAGVDPEDLGVSTTSRTYQNDQNRRKHLLDFTLGGYLRAFEDRLSMDDVTRPGLMARGDLSAFLRTDDLTRMQTYEIGLRVGAIDGHQEVRALEDKPPLTNTPEEPPVTPAAPTPLRAVAAHDVQPISFSAEGPEVRMEAAPEATFSVDREARTISGLLVPYGVPGKSGGQTWQFSQGTLTWTDPTRVKLWVMHDPQRAVGFATELDDRPDGLYGTFKVARGAAGDEALTMAEDGVWDGFSVGVKQGGQYRRIGQVNHAVKAPLMEVSLTPSPVFDDARAHDVAASAAATTTGGNNRMNKQQRARLAALRAQQSRTEAEETEYQGLLVMAAEEAEGRTDDAAEDTTPVTAEGVTQAVAAGIAQAAQTFSLPVGGGRVPVPAGGPQFAQTQVREELPYRFDGIPAANCFSDDLHAAFQSGDSEARQRLQTFLDVAFDVTTANAAALNPTQNRPELYVPNLEYSRPLWDLVSKGTLTDKTAFTIPKFSSATNLAATHTEGVEPAEATFTATTQTVTPTAISGKAEIVRELWDQGGNPKVDQIIWNEMVGAYYEHMEARLNTALAAVPTAELNLASAVDEALVDALQNYFVGLQYVRGGNRYTGLALDGTLFGALVNASDTSGRKLLPVLAPQNAQGETNGAFDRVTIGGLTGRAAWALGSGNAAKSYNFVPSSVYGWMSAPKRFTFEFQVSTVVVAIWGYGAAAITRDSDVKPIDYTTADV